MKWMIPILMIVLLSCEKDQYGTYEYRLHGPGNEYQVRYLDPETGEHIEIVEGFWTHSGEILERSAFYLECQDTTALLTLYLFFPDGGGIVINSKTKIYLASWY